MPKRNRQAGKEETNFVKKVFKDKLDSQEVIEDASENDVTEGSSRDIKTEPNNVETRTSNVILESRGTKTVKEVEGRASHDRHLVHLQEQWQR